MQAANAYNSFQEYLTATGRLLDLLTPNQAIEAMIQYYKEVRADDVDLEADGDMLLFQWGVYDWGKGESFEYDITRQLIYVDNADSGSTELEAPGGDDANLVDDADDDEAETIFGQLSLTLKFEATDALRAIEPGNRWCYNLDDLPAFVAFVEQCEATRAVQHAPVMARELNWGDAE